MTENPPVILRATITIDGVDYTYDQPIARATWEGNPSRRYFESVARDALGRHVMATLKPPVTVLKPSNLTKGEPPTTTKEN